jgi:hypothetical protein
MGNEQFAAPAADAPKDAPKVSKGWSVPAAANEEFQRRFKDLFDDEIEVACQPIPFSCLDTAPLVEVVQPDGTTKMIEPITAAEFMLLGPFVIDDTV